MKTTRTLFGFALLFTLALALAAVTGASADDQTTTDTTASTVVHGRHFVDANGDGYNDNAPDDDGDGIPNGQDPDYTRPQDGTGKHLGAGKHLGKGRGNGAAAVNRFNRGMRRGNCNCDCAAATDTTDESADSNE